jgi:hypothetical protein
VSETPNTWEVARHGIVLVVAEIRQRGGTVTPKSGPGARNRLVLRTQDGRLSLYVKTRRRGDWQTDARKGQPRELDPDETSFWIFVDLLDDPPGFYIVPESWVENDIYKNHAAYLERHGGRRAINPLATHHRITSERVLPWRNRWDLLGLVLEKETR